MLLKGPVGCLGILIGFIWWRRVETPSLLVVCSARSSRGEENKILVNQGPPGFLLQSIGLSTLPLCCTLAAFSFTLCWCDVLSQTNAPTMVRERVLGLIQTWADNFRGRLELEPVCSAYDDLRRAGKCSRRYGCVKQSCSSCNHTCCTVCVRSCAEWYSDERRCSTGVQCFSSANQWL